MNIYIIIILRVNIQIKEESMGNNYEIAYKEEWNKLKKLDPFDVSKRLDVKYCSNKNQFTIIFLNEELLIDFKTESIYSKMDGKRPLIGDSIIILNYLTYSKDYIAEIDKIVSLKEIPNGGALFYPAFHKSSIVQLINTFGYDIKQFEKNASKIGSEEVNIGDKGYKFKVLPKINIYIAIWEGDDEIPPNATILFEPSIEKLVHIETVIGIGMRLANKVIIG